MQIETLAADEHSDFLDLVDAAIRPDGATTAADNDFPLALGLENREGIYVAKRNRELLGGLACLVRPFTTSLGTLTVAGIGSVVTRPDVRGRGVSSRLQQFVLDELRQREVPLAVLWTDNPEIYAGRGFESAGYEFHVDISQADLADLLPAWATIRPFCPADTNVVARIYADHRLRTVRQPGDDRKLYTMPGTAGFVVEDRDRILLAYCFCGKGADFGGYVTEWGGQRSLVAPLLGAVRDRGLARRVLVPAGERSLLDALVERGAGWFALASGQWAVLTAGPLVALARDRGAGVPSEAAWNRASAWLGDVDDSGLPREGPFSLAVWGFDSV